MIQRCTNEKHPSYKNYGGRGIGVCAEWIGSFLNFYNDMGDRPEGTWLDRIDNSSGYCKENCRWASISDQIFNQRIKSTNTSGKTGVYYDKQRNKWAAEIKKGSKRLRLGRFLTFEEAAEARDSAELQLYGKKKEIESE